MKAHAKETTPVALAPVAIDLGWQDFLSQLKSARAADVRTLWTRLHAAMPSLQLPQAGTVPDDGFQLVWNEGRHHINIEIVGDGEAEWFYLDRETRKTAGDEFRVRDPLPRALLERLAYSAPESR